MDGLNQFNASIWGDEGFSAILSMKSIPQILDIIIKDTSPPLYNITEHFWFGLFGTGEVAIRALSFLYYCLAILFVYKIGAFVFNRKTGIIVAALSFLNPFFFIYAFEGRMYSIMAFGVAASMYFFVRIWDKEGGKKWDRIGYVAATAWALYSHHFAIFALFVQGLWWLKMLVFGDREVAKGFIKLFLFVGLLYLPWMYPLYKQTSMVGGGFWLGTPTVNDLRNLIYEYLAQGIAHPLAKPALWVVFATLALRRWGSNFQKSLFLLSWFLVPILATWGVSQKFQSIFYNRYLLYAIPGAMIILGSSRRKWSMITIGVLITMFAVIDWHYFTHPAKKPFRDYAEYVKSVKRGDDYLVNWNSNGAHHLWETKYYGIPAPIYLPEGDLPYFVGTALMSDEDIVREIPAKTRRVGVVTSGPIEEVGIDGFSRGEVREFGQLKFILME